MSRRGFAGMLITLAVLPLIAAYAGGWATITVESLPDHLVAQQPTNLTFSIRQHGMELLGDLNPSIEARSGDNEYAARAVPTNRKGYYTALLNLPRPGTWTVTIKSGFGPSNVTLLPIPAVSAGGRAPVALSENERGQRLFVAKGCLTCHEHARVPESGRIKVGPDLTDRGLDAGYLSRFLADPKVKTVWATSARMPDLNLNKNEVASLIAFLNGPQQRQAGK